MCKLQDWLQEHKSHAVGTGFGVAGTLITAFLLYLCGWVTSPPKHPFTYQASQSQFESVPIELPNLNLKAPASDAPEELHRLYDRLCYEAEKHTSSIGDILRENSYKEVFSSINLTNSGDLLATDIEIEMPWECIAVVDTETPEGNVKKTYRNVKIIPIGNLPARKQVTIKIWSGSSWYWTYPFLRYSNGGLQLDPRTWYEKYSSLIPLMFVFGVLVIAIVHSKLSTLMGNASVPAPKHKTETRKRPQRNGGREFID